MSKRVNEKFLSLYIELDRLCCERFGVPSGGVTEYINRLNNARFAPDRDEVLPKLVNFRNIKYKFSSEPGAIRRSDEISKADITWVKRFIKYMRKKKDPIAVYIKRARRYMRMRRFRKFITVVGLVLLGIAVLVIALLLMLKK